VFRRAAHLIWGADVDEALRPVLLVTLMGAVASSSSWSFMGIWAVKQLGATSGQLAFGYLVSALVGGFVGYAGGHLSDVFGRRTLILAGDGALALYVLLFLLAGHNVLLGLGLMAGAGALGSFSRSAGQAMVADIVPRERHELGYAAVRVASNLGVTMGPPVGGLFLLVGGWTAFFPGVSALALGAWTLAFLYLPQRGAYAPESRPERGSLRVIIADHAFLLFIVASVFSWLVYVGYETVLPVSLVQSHGVPVWGWGALAVINPLLVTLFQLRLTRRVARYSIVPKWIAAMLLMGLPFLLFGLTSAIPVIVLVLVLFVIGEMLWVPVSSSIVAGLAPADVRGAYMGAFGGSSAAGFALAPFLGLQVRDAAGDTAMWSAFAGVSIVSAVLGAIACRGVRRRRHGEPAPSAVLES
jgi:MFS family permease